jgi:1,4-dihydroxy-2-naphthoate octaprenyltransferase
MNLEIMNLANSLKSWVMAFRLKTLTAALVPVVAGTWLVPVLGHSTVWSLSVWALVSSLFIQIGTNLINDAMDFKKGADNEKRIGPQRVTQSGLFSAGTVLAVGTFFFALAVLAGLPLVFRGGLPIISIGLFSVLCGYAYTAGPFPLAYKGLGDLFVIIFFGVVAVMGVVYLHTLEWRFEAFVLGLQIGFLSKVLIAINNLRDVHGDKKVNKKTLPVRFGIQFGRYEIAFLILSTFLLQFYWLLKGLNFVFVVGFVVSPLAVKLLRSVFRTEPSAEYNKFLGKAAGLHLVFGLLLATGFWLQILTLKP